MPNFGRQARLHRYSKPKFCVWIPAELGGQVLLVVELKMPQEA